MAEVHIRNRKQEARLEDAKQHLMRLILDDDKLQDMVAEVVYGTLGRRIPRADDDVLWYDTQGAVITKLLARVIDDMYYPAGRR